MRTILSLTMGVLLSLWLMTGYTSAQTDLGHFCFQLTPFADVLDLQVNQPVDGQPFFTFPVTWDGASVYTLQGAGQAWQQGAALLLTSRYRHDTAFFGGNPDGQLTAMISLTTLRGPYAFDFQGDTLPFFNSGELVNVPCEASLIVQFVHPSGALAGETP